MSAAVELRPPAGRFVIAGKNAHQRRLARAVGAEQAEDPGADLGGKAVEPELCRRSNFLETFPESRRRP